MAEPALWWIMLGAGIGLCLVLGIPVLRELFHFSGDTPRIFGAGALAACCVLLLSAAVKRILRAFWREYPQG